jgi:hypothetical protein
LETIIYLVAIKQTANKYTARAWLVKTKEQQNKFVNYACVNYHFQRIFAYLDWELTIALLFSSLFKIEWGFFALNFAKTIDFRKINMKRKIKRYKFEFYF